MIAGTVPTFSRIWSGDPQPIATLETMEETVMEQYQEPAVVQLATRIAVTVREKDTAAIANAIMRFLRRSTRFVADPVGSQYLKTPTYMLALIQTERDQIAGGDCADLAMLAAALCLAVGIPAKLVAESYDGPVGLQVARLVHVYAIAQVGEGWWNLDTQRQPWQMDTRPVYRVAVDLP